MRKHKGFTAVILAVLLAFACLGCGEKDFTAESSKLLVEEILGNVEFQKELTELPETLLGTAYELSEGVEAEAYTAGYPADRFAVFFCEDSSKIPEVKTMLSDKTNELIDTYSSYDTSQVGKLENAIIEVKGNYVIFVVTDDYENAKKIVDKY